MAGQGQPVTSQVARRTRKAQSAVAIRMVYVYILGMVVVAVIARRAGVDQIVPSHSATKLEAWSVVARHKARLGSVDLPFERVRPRRQHR